MTQFTEGLYDLIIENGLVEQAEAQGFQHITEQLSAETSAQRLTDLISAELAKLVSELNPNEPPNQRVLGQAQFLNQLMVHVRERAQVNAQHQPIDKKCLPLT